MRNIRWVCIAAGIILTFMSCSLNIFGYTQGYERQQLSDTNWIAQAGDTYTYWRREGSILSSSVDLRFSRFFGRESLWTIEVQQEGYLDIACSVNSSQGPFEVVLVQASTKQVIRVARQQGSVANRYYLKEGTYVIKILGYDASGSIAMALSYPQGISSSVITMKF